MLDRVNGIWRALAGGLLLAMAATTAMAQSQPMPPTGLSVNDEPPGTDTPPTEGLILADSFDYTVNKFDSGDAKIERFRAAGWNGVKDEQTRPGGAAGYMYTRTDAPGCGSAPSGRMLTMEGRPRSLGMQTDFYLGLGDGTAGDIPARLYVQFDLCVSRSGTEMSDIDSVHDKLLYPLFGSRDGYPMATEDTAWLQGMSTHKYEGSRMIEAPEAGAFTFMNNATRSADGPRASISDQVGSGSGSLMTPNVGDPWIRPNRWYTVRFLFDVSGAQGTYRAWVGSIGQPLALVADFRGGVTPGFTWSTAPLDRIGAKRLRIPTTWGTVSGAGPDRWMNIDNLRIADTENALQ